MDAILLNPLPDALAHYAGELAETLERIGIESRILSPDPATDSRTALLARRAFAHAAAVRAATIAGTPTIALWPAFGWLEPAVWAGRGRRAAIVVHDPIPIRRQYGEGRMARRLAAGLTQRFGPALICHTREAATATATRLRIGPPPVALHPIATPVPPVQVRAAKADGDPVVLVAGQFKPSRDTALLAALGPRLRADGLRPRIVGRGWQELPGWDVRAEFVSEEELDAEIRSAAAVLVPYRRYWQSGIAVRALESGLPVVGAPTVFLRTLLGNDWGGFPVGEHDAESWRAAIASVIDGEQDVDRRRAAYQERVDRSWAHLFDSTFGEPSHAH